MTQTIKTDGQQVSTTLNEYQSIEGVHSSMIKGLQV